MDPSPVLHPTDQTLSAYGLGKLDDHAAEAVNKHLEECSECRKRAAEISSDSFLDHVRNAQKGPGKPTFGGPPSASGGTQGDNRKNAATPFPTDTLPPGLADHPDYQIRRELGRGGMGVVYLAHNTLMGRDEVLKVMGRQIMERPEVLERFLREIRAVAKLRHTNIVAAYSATRIGESIVFAMEYVPGLDLNKMVKAKGPLPVAHACNFVHQAALGLQHAYEEGLVHRDIKPANLMLSRKGDKAMIKVLDFGLAKVVREEKVDRELTLQGQALGTPDYIAPEQIIDAPSADIRADIYSLGGTLYYLLTARPPFHAKSLYDIYQAHISRDAEPLNLVRPDVPAELAALVAKMMAKDPARRFQTPGEVARALTPFFKKANAALTSPKADVSQAGQTNGGWPVPVAVSTPGQAATDGGNVAGRAKKADGVTVAESGWGSLIAFREEERSAAAAPVVQPTRRPPWLWSTVAASLLLLGALTVWMGGVFKVRTPDGVIVLEDLPKGAEVFVDGTRMTVSWPGGREPVEIRAVPGQHRVEVKKAGFKVFGEVVTVKAEGSEEVTVRLEPLDASRSVGLGGTPTGAGKGRGARVGEARVPAADPRDGARAPNSPTYAPQRFGPPLTIAAHGDLIWGVAFNPDGRRLASVGQDGSVKIWDATTGKMTQELARESTSFFSVSWSSDGKTLAAANALDIRLFDGVTGEPSRILKVNAERPRCVTISADCKFMAAGGYDNLVKVWDLTTGQLRVTLRGHTSTVFGVAFSHDGKSIASASWDRTVRLWDAAAGEERHRFEGHQGDVLHVEFSPDDRTLASSGADGTVRLWDIAGGPARLVLRDKRWMDRVWWVTYSPHGRILAAGSDAVTRFWDAGSGLDITSTPTSAPHAYCVSFSADGRRLAVAENSESRHEIKVWELPAEPPSTVARATTPAPTRPRLVPEPVERRPVAAPALYIKGNVEARGTSRGPVDVEIFDEDSDPLKGQPPPSSMSSLRRRPALVMDGILDATIFPGVYEGGFKISGICHAFLAPGVYVLKGGGLSLSGACSLSGSEVVILNISSNETDAINVSGTIEITPPTTLGGLFKTFNGISIYQPPDSNAPIKLDGNSEVTLAGTLYAPGARLMIGGNAALHINRDTVTDLPGRAILSDLALEGNGDLRFNSPSTRKRSRIPPKGSPR